MNLPLHGLNHFKKGDIVRINNGEELKETRIAKVTEPEASGVDVEIIYPPQEVGLILFWHMNLIKMVLKEELRPLLEK